MNVTKFTARDMREALKEVKAKLGEDAVILSTRSIREPGSGLSLGRTVIEVTACPTPNAQESAQESGRENSAAAAPSWALPAKPETGNTTATPVPGRFSRVVDDPIDYAIAEPQPSQKTANKWQQSESKTSNYERGKWPQAEQQGARHASGEWQQQPAPPPSTPQLGDPQPNNWPQSGAGAQASVETIAPPNQTASDGLATANLATPSLATVINEPANMHPLMANSADMLGLDAEGKRQYSWLLMHGVEDLIARKIAAMKRPGREHGLSATFQRALQFHDPLSSKARVIALVGPTGVGKTTTLAKIAADLILNRQRSVGMITLDTFRVGAVAQLETYAKLLQVRLVVARSLSEVKAGLHSLNRCDYVLVDTVGSSPYNRRQVNSTAGLLPVMGDKREVILCMAANVREAEQQAIYRRFSILKPTGLLFTKLDETVTYGGILNVSIKANLPLTLYTDGQRVPENLGWMSANELARWFEEESRREHE